MAWLTTTALLPGAAVLAAGLALGCARNAEERQLDALRDAIDRIQMERDEADQQAMPQDPEDHPSTASVPPRQPAPAMSSLNAVSLGTGTAAQPDDYADTEDTTPRPTLRVSGAAAGRHGRARDRDDVVEETLPDEGAPGSGPAQRPSSLDPEAKRAYDAAFSLVTAHQYDRALDALAAFLMKWPDHPYADNAMYWRGECYFARGDFLSAQEQFEGVLARFPAGNKVPDALLKLGVTSQRLGNPSKAKDCFDRLERLYPQSEAARRIPSVNAPAASPSAPASEDHR
jgi:tol-pal system protein YbgF